MISGPYGCRVHPPCGVCGIVVPPLHNISHICHVSLNFRKIWLKNILIKTKNLQKYFALFLKKNSRFHKIFMQFFHNTMHISQVIRINMCKIYVSNTGFTIEIIQKNVCFIFQFMAYLKLTSRALLPKFLLKMWIQACPLHFRNT